MQSKQNWVILFDFKNTVDFQQSWKNDKKDNWNKEITISFVFKVSLSFCPNGNLWRARQSATTAKFP